MARAPGRRVGANSQALPLHPVKAAAAAQKRVPLDYYATNTQRDYLPNFLRLP
jgi:hypothetical protein